jgi:hypothetical protein
MKKRIFTNGLPYPSPYTNKEKGKEGQSLYVSRQDRMISSLHSTIEPGKSSFTGHSAAVNSQLGSKFPSAIDIRP